MSSTEMVIVFVVLLVVLGGFSEGFPQERATVRAPEEAISDSSVKDIYDSYYAISDNKEEDEELNVVSQIQRVDLNKIKYSSVYDINGETYVVVKTSRHRNKRYSSYLTLCPFKICNMGRKRIRTRRYLRPIRAENNNEGT